MPLIRRCRISLTLEYMSQMPSTVGAHNFGPAHSKSTVGMSRYSAWNGVKESGPSTARLELVVCFVEWCGARGAGVDPGLGGMFVVLSSESWLGALFTDYAELFRRQDCLPFLIRFLDWESHVL